MNKKLGHIIFIKIIIVLFFDALSLKNVYDLGPDPGTLTHLEGRGSKSQ